MSASLTRNRVLYGSDRAPARAVALRAGALQMSFDPETAFVRRITLADREVLRGVYMAVRDQRWGTVTPFLRDLAVSASSDSFSISFTARCKRDEIDFEWLGHIEGDSEGTVLWSMKGRALSEFFSNRIGFCILHPTLECAGKPCSVEKVDGSVVQGHFPERISPHQPFLDMRAIAHEVSGGLSAEVRLEGGVFEMEDQRNWTDASYKIYCPPLSLPIPVKIARDAQYEQSVTLRLRGSGLQSAKNTAAALGDRGIRITVGERSGRLPSIGLQIGPAEYRLSDQARARLLAIKPHHLRVDLRLSSKEWPTALRAAAEVSRALEAPLEAALMLSDRGPEELVTLVRELENVRPLVCSWLVFHEREDCTSSRWTKLARDTLSARNPGALFCAGSDRYFAELNRGSPPQDIDMVCFPADPQVHLFDSESMVETLAMLAQCVTNAKILAGGLPVAVSPLTLHSRGQDDDARQTSLFAGAWTVGATKSLASGGARSATFFEILGSRGVMTEGASPESVYPVYHVLADMEPFAEKETLVTASTSPLEVEALALLAGAKMRVLIANLTDREQRVSIQLAGTRSPAGPGHVLMLDETSAAEALGRPEDFRSREGDPCEAHGGRFELALLPYAVARLDTSA